MSMSVSRGAISSESRVAHPNRLPPEILATIFVLLAEELYWWHPGTPYLWLKVTHTCRYWRNVALDCAPLWSRIAPTHPEFMKLLLSRSKAASLDVIMKYSDWLEDDKKEEDDIQAFATALYDILYQVERLRRLTFISRASGKKITASHVVEALSSAILRDEIGRLPLQVMNLHKISVPWAQLPLPAGLTELVLDNDLAPRPLATELLDSLAALPVLECLHLSGLLPEAGDLTGGSTSPPLALSALKSIQTEDTFTNLIHFFDSIRIPGITDTGVTIVDSYVGRLHLERCVQAVKASLADAARRYPDFCHLRVEFLGFTSEIDPRIGLGFHGRTTGVAHDGDIEFYISFSLPNQVEFIPEDILETITLNFDYSGLRSLLFYINDCDFSLNTFAHLTQLEVITFDTTPFTEFLLTLQDDPALEDPSRSLKPYFSALKTLNLFHVPWNTDGVPVNEWVTTAINVLGKRPAPYLVGQVGIIEPLFFGEQQYQALVDGLSPMTVTWDGEERWPGSQEDSECSDDQCSLSNEEGDEERRENGEGADKELEG